MSNQNIWMLGMTFFASRSMYILLSYADVVHIRVIIVTASFLSTFTKEILTSRSFKFTHREDAPASLSKYPFLSVQSSLILLHNVLETQCPGHS